MYEAVVEDTKSKRQVRVSDKRLKPSIRLQGDEIMNEPKTFRGRFVFELPLVSRALNYLHCHDPRGPAFHRNVKSANIVLDVASAPNLLTVASPSSYPNKTI